MTNGSKSLIHLEGVTKVFLTDEVETHALSGIHLDIATGEYVSIAGPSGCGKSTLLSILGLRWDGTSREAFTESAFGRATATSGGRARACGQAGDSARG